MKSFYLTTPIYYVNDAPHIGHAYTTVAGDVLTRWHRQRGESVWFLTGTDEHGQKVMRTAEANGVAPQAWADKLVEEAWKPNWQALNIANDDFIRTTETRHMDRVQKFLTSLKDKGYIYQGDFEGPYCVGCEEFKLPGDLLEGNLCPIHSKPVENVKETNWFFKLSEFAQPLLDHYKNNPGACQPESARNEVVAFLEGGVRDLSISRSTFDWGVPVPWDTDQVVYVWFDALLNYATAVGLTDDAESEGGKKFANTWPADVHLVGKDILRFHAVIWPAMLMAAGLEVPKKVFAHGWLLVGGEKMSKSKLTGIAPSQITDTFGSDAFRYYFMKAIAFGQDGSFSWEDLSARYQAELANGFGNLASRSIAMIHKYFDGVLPAAGDFSEDDLKVQQVAADAVAAANAAIDEIAIQDAINAAWTLVDELNNYITVQAPWVLAKDEANTERLGTVLNTTAEGLRALAVLLNPITPKATAKLWSALVGDGELDAQVLDNAGVWGQLKAGSKISQLEPLFPRIETDEAK